MKPLIHLCWIMAIGAGCLSSTTVAQASCGDEPSVERRICEDRYTTLRLSVREGAVRFLMPSRRPPDELVGSRLFLEPAGNTEGERNRNLAALRSYYLNWRGQVRSIGKETVSWRVVSDPHFVQGSICIQDSTGRPVPTTNSVQACASVDGPKMWYEEAAPANAPFEVPSIHLNRSPLRIAGPFDGNIENTRITIAGEPATILAEFPGEASVAPPSLTGLVLVEVQEAAFRGVRQTTRLLELSVVPDFSRRKERVVTAIVQVTGLVEPDPLLITVQTFFHSRISWAKATDVKVKKPSLPFPPWKEPGSWVPLSSGHSTLLSRPISMFVPMASVSADGSYHFTIGLKTRTVLEDWDLKRPNPLESLFIYFDFRRLESLQGTVAVVGSAIDDWSLENAVEISPAARQEIVSSFNRDKDLILEKRTALTGMTNNGAYYKFLTRLYLYELLKKVSSRSRRVPAGARYFSSSEPQPVIDKVSVVTLTLRSVLNGVWFMLTLQRSPIEIKSTPEQRMRVEVDSAPPEGSGDRTNTMVRMTVGTHHLIIFQGSKRCSESLHIPCAGLTGEIVCDSNSEQMRVTLRGLNECSAAPSPSR